MEQSIEYCYSGDQLKLIRFASKCHHTFKNIGKLSKVSDTLQTYDYLEIILKIIILRSLLLALLLAVLFKYKNKSIEDKA